MNRPITLAASILWLSMIVGCGESSHKAQRIETPPTTQTMQSEAPAARPAQETVNPSPGAPSESNASKVSNPSAQLRGFYRIFKDGASIDPAGKPMLLVFGQSADPYTRKLQRDVEQSEDLARSIRESVTPIYLDARANKRHKFMHSGQMMDVDTKTLLGIYRIDATPTLIFADEKGATIFIVPGYMPPRQFLVTLRFVAEGTWKGKDRKNGEIYRTLKSYYQAHGVKVGGPKQ